jgi:hypothetical protein
VVLGAVAKFCLIAGSIGGEFIWSKRVTGIFTGAVTRSVRTPTIGSSVVKRVAGRAGIAWIIAGLLLGLLGFWLLGLLGMLQGQGLQQGLPGWQEG